ncbi:TPA: ash family protein [Mannheimia haemolytica]
MSRKFNFTSGQKSAIFYNAQAKSCAERGNSNNLLVANISTPFNRAFFVRGLNTPKENNQSKNGFVTFLSMVAFSGQRLIVGCVPQVAVFHPAKRYRQAVESKAIDSENLLVELSAMIYKFLTLTGNKRLKITVQANSKAEALSRIQFTNKPLLIARLQNQFAKNQQNLTACEGVIYA